MSQHDINREQWVKFYYTKNKQLPELFGRYNTGALIVVERQKGDKVDEQRKETGKFYELYRDDKLLSSGYGFQSLDLVNSLTNIATKYDNDTAKITNTIEQIKDTLDLEYIKKNSNLEDAYIIVNTNGSETKLSVSKLLDVENPFFEDLDVTSAVYNIRYGYASTTDGQDENVQVPITLVNNKPVLYNVSLDIPIGTFIKEITCSFSYKLNDTLGIDKSGCTFNLYTKDGTPRRQDILPNIDELNSDGVKTENVTVTLLLNANASESIIPSIAEQTVLSDLKFKVKYGLPSTKKVLYKNTEGGPPIYVKDNFYNRPDTYIVLPKITIDPKTYFIHCGIDESSNEIQLSKLSIDNAVEVESLDDTIKCDYIVNKKNMLLLPKGTTVSRAYLVDKKTGKKESISSAVKYVQKGDAIKTVQVPWIPYTVTDQRGVTEMNLYVVAGLSNITENDDMSILLDINYEPTDYFHAATTPLNVANNLTILGSGEMLKTVIDEMHENLYWHGVTDLSTINLYK
nr:MAG TPA: hypothetical protein [Caudoviricetes sp.]